MIQTTFYSSVFSWKSLSVSVSFSLSLFAHFMEFIFQLYVHSVRMYLPVPCLKGNFSSWSWDKRFLPLSNHILTKWILLNTGTCVEMDGPVWFTSLCLWWMNRVLLMAVLPCLYRWSGDWWVSLIHLSLSMVDEWSSFNNSFAMPLSLKRTSSHKEITHRKDKSTYKVEVVRKFPDPNSWELQY